MVQIYSLVEQKVVPRNKITDPDYFCNTVRIHDYSNKKVVF